MKPLNLFALLAAAAAAFSSLAFAEPGSTPASPDVVAKLKTLYPNTRFNAINATTMPGITEVVMGRKRGVCRRHRALFPVRPSV